MKLARRAALGGAILAIAAAAQTPSWGQSMADALAVRSACSVEMNGICRGILPGGGRVLQCLNAHAKELSAGCHSAVSRATPAPKAK